MDLLSTIGESSQTLPTIVTAVLAIASPLLTAIFTKVTTTPVTKNNIALAVSFVIAAVYVVMTAGIQDWNDLTQIMSVLPVIYVMQQTSFRVLVRDWTKEVEATVGAGTGIAKVTTPELPVADVVEPVVPIEEETPAKG